MRNVTRITQEGKIRPIRRRAADATPAVNERAGLITLIQTLIPLDLQAVGDAVEAEVADLAEGRHSPIGGQPGYVRWCQQQGSAYLLDQKLPITYTRVLDGRRNVE